MKGLLSDNSFFFTSCLHPEIANAFRKNIENLRKHKGEALGSSHASLPWVLTLKLEKSLVARFSPSWLRGGGRFNWTRLQICPRNTFSEAIHHRWYHSPHLRKYWKLQGFFFGLDFSGPNLQARNNSLPICFYIKEYSQRNSPFPFSEGWKVKKWYNSMVQKSHSIPNHLDVFLKPL